MDSFFLAFGVAENDALKQLEDEYADVIGAANWTPHIYTTPRRLGFHYTSLEIPEQRLVEDMRMYRHNFASDDWDKAFGLNGMTSRSPIVPDYTKSTHDIYVQLAVHYITSGHYWDVLSQCGSIPYPKSTLNLPSWVPDWSKSSST